jgi:hypothetical protein
VVAIRSDVGARIAAVFREMLLSEAAAARCTASSKDKRRRDRRRSRTVAPEMIVIAADGLPYLTEAISGDHKKIKGFACKMIVVQARIAGA